VAAQRRPGSIFCIAAVVGQTWISSTSAFFIAAAGIAWRKATAKPGGQAWYSAQVRWQSIRFAGARFFVSRLSLPCGNARHRYCVPDNFIVRFCANPAPPDAAPRRCNAKPATHAADNALLAL